MPLRFLTAGESHGPALVAVLDGMPAGIRLNSEIIDLQLARRQQGYGAGPRMKIEKDHASILGGIMEGFTTGAPLVFQIENADHARWKGKSIPPFTIPRPGHADLSGALKYGYSDLRPALAARLCPRNGRPSRSRRSLPELPGSLWDQGWRVRSIYSRD